MMDTVTKTKVYRILASLYPKVTTLDNYCASVANLSREEDTALYKKLVTRTLVCALPSGKPFPSNAKTTVTCHQSEVIDKAVERIRKRDGHQKNLLTMGFSRLSDNPHARIAPSSSLEYSYPNSNTSALLSPSWGTLLARIGDELMLHLLENAALFAPCPNHCYIQLCGVPVYDLWPCVPNPVLKIQARVKDEPKVRRVKPQEAQQSKRSRPPKKVTDDIKEANSFIRNEGTLSFKQSDAVRNNDGVAPPRKRKSNQVSEQQKKKPRLDSDVVDAASGNVEANGKADVPNALSDSNLQCCVTVLKSSPIFKNVKKIKLDSDFNEALHHSVFKSLGKGAESTIVAAQNTVATPGVEMAEIETVSAQGISDIEALNTSGLDIAKPVLDVPNTSAASESKVSNKSETVSMLLPAHDETVQDPAVCNIMTMTQSLAETATIETPGKGTAVPDCDKVVDDAPQVERTGTRKRKRHRRKKRFNDGEKEAGSAYDYHKSMDRISILYAKDLREQFQSTGLFNLQPVEGDVQKLFNEVFGSFDIGGTVVLTDQDKAKLKPKVNSLFQKLIQNNTKCPYRYLLGYYNKICNGDDIENKTEHTQVKVPVFTRSKHGSSKVLDLQKESRKAQKKKPVLHAVELLQESMPHRNVFLFLRNIVHRVMPQEMFGSSLNTFLARLRTFVSLGRYEKFCLGRLMTGMKVTDCEWLSGITSHLLRQHCLAHFVWWLLTCFICPVLRAFFYATDTTVHRNRVFYYRKKTWMRLRQKTIAAYLSTGMLQRISQERVDTMQLDGQSLGVSNLRFLPKAKTLRPIVNMGKLPIPAGNGQSINKSLEGLHNVLSDLQERNPHAFGSSIFGLDDIYVKLHCFIEQRRSKNDNRRLYFVKADIAQCYDTIVQQKVLDIVCKLLDQNEHEDYIVRRWARVILDGGIIKRSFHRSASPMSAFSSNFKVFLDSYLEKKPLRHAIVVDQVLHVHEKSASLVEKLRAHLFGNVIKIGKQFYLQVVGISQGAVTSTLLCNLYYADMERSVLAGKCCLGERCSCRKAVEERDTRASETPSCKTTAPSKETQETAFKLVDSTDTPRRSECRVEAEPPTPATSDHSTQNTWGDDELLMRMVDDFLFITPHLEHAQTFLLRLTSGIPEYNCRVNNEKTLVNFDNNIQGVRKVSNNAWLPWCGILIHPQTLETQVDYTRYIGVSVRDTMTCGTTPKPGEALKQKLQMAMRVKCHAMFFDKINSMPVIGLNMYRAFLLVAFKLHAIARNLPLPARNNPSFFLSTILSLPGVLMKQIERKLKGGNDCLLLREAPMTWLCIQAFLNKLQMHQGGYQGIIQGLTRTQRALKMPKSTLRMLKMASRECIPDEFELMLD